MKEETYNNELLALWIILVGLLAEKKVIEISAIIDEVEASIAQAPPDAATGLWRSVVHILLNHPAPSQKTNLQLVEKDSE